ncbi:hypothetical protein BY996DRAFT_6688576 [Phakopsora pachyrhizi]|uniref:CFEM domain-containing protein n=1 Tax=Phakopsora pachyrhizi TaxID=170000 RepID=A0AAV0BDV0_PHAPC|nr:hypothetical protein BY996DRAFT_6688576 [Phakopsora pachyrhizi]CAH7683474.1 hypothetical protein PPACK8108_LOCUS17008 [Phakopsora pachyrhizi]CAH7683881.1 hypothetical protein PPACK8108_LOCUS17671 [Phakopsora pachyrhizi]
MSLINRSILIVVVVLSLTSLGSVLSADGQKQPNGKMIGLLREIQSLPPCAQQCLRIAPPSGCGQTDIACLCKSEARKNQIKECGDKCKPADNTALSNFGQKTCDTVVKGASTNKDAVAPDEEDSTKKGGAETSNKGPASASSSTGRKKVTLPGRR